MQINLDNQKYKVEIVRKLTNRNTYIRIKKNKTIYVTTNTFVSDKKILEIIESSKASILKMITKTVKKEEKKESGYYYLGNKIDVVYTNNKEPKLINNTLLINKDYDIDKWYKKESEIYFQHRLDYWYKKFTEKIPYPKLVVRKMKTRWGVCNNKLKKITLNQELLKMDINCMDYVIVHELSHFIYMNHSKDFWSLVSKYYPNYKEIRKKMKEE